MWSDDEERLGDDGHLLDDDGDGWDWSMYVE
jgi:hypothetical protein